MKRPSRVTFEATADGYSWAVDDEDGNRLGVYEMVRHASGFQGTEGAENFGGDMKAYPDILHTLEDLPFVGMSISNALRGYLDEDILPLEHDSNGDLHYPFEYDEADFHPDIDIDEGNGDS